MTGAALTSCRLSRTLCDAEQSGEHRRFQGKDSVATQRPVFGASLVAYLTHFASVESHTRFETPAPYYTQNGSDMEIKWIEDFIALSQYQSFSRAAEFRNVTQSGFSRRIQSLEQ